MFEPKRGHIESRQEFERNINLLKETMKMGRISISEELRGRSHIVHGLMKARSLPNKRTDFSTIDESVRSMANSISQMLLHKNNNNEEE